MAKRPSTRTTNHADFSGPDAEKEAIEQLAEQARKKNEKAGKKANAGDVAEETVSMHIMLIKAAEGEWREARDKASELQGVLRNRYKVAKGDGVDIDSLKLAFRIAERSSGEVVSEQRNVGRYLRIMGSPLGTQWNLFEEGVDEDRPVNGDTPRISEPELAGQHAASNGEPRSNNPHQPGSQDFIDWDMGHANREAAYQRIFPSDSDAATH